MGRSPVSIAARRTFVAGTPAALATASATMPASAPWRSSPRSSRRKKSASSGVARAARSSSNRRRVATDPEPAVTASSSRTGVQVADGQRRLRRRADDRRGGPSDTDLALSRSTAQCRDGGLDLVGLHAGEELGERGDLRGSRSRARHRGGRGDEVSQQHARPWRGPPSQSRHRQGRRTPWRAPRA